MYLLPELRFPTGDPKREFVNAVQRLGEAFIIASLVGFMFERLMSDERLKAFREMVEMLEKFDGFGFKEVYVDRQRVFNILFRDVLNHHRELKILGICVSFFRETERPTRVSQEHTSQSIINQLATAIVEHECQTEVLFLRRYPSDEQLQRYCAPATHRSAGAVHADFYCMREWDEDGCDFWGGKRLKKIANQSVGAWIRVYLDLAKKTSGMSEEDRREVIQRLQLKEYLALPSLSLCVVDDEIYVTPYLYRRHCSDVPAFRVAGRSKPLYQAYYAHFDKMWKDELTCWMIPYQFLDELIRRPLETMTAFDKTYNAVIGRHNGQAENDEAYRESPEFFRAEEETVAILIEEARKQRSASA